MLFFADISKKRNFHKVFRNKRIAFPLMMTRNIVEVDGKALRCYSVSRKHMALDIIDLNKH
jgi:hypothetical protein